MAADARLSGSRGARRQCRLQIADCRGDVTRRLRLICLVLMVAVAAAGCGAARAFRQGDAAMRRGDLDQAVALYRRAVQDDPDNARYKISLERAMQAASRFHLDRAREFEQQDQLE